MGITLKPSTLEKSKNRVLPKSVKSRQKNMKKIFLISSLFAIIALSSFTTTSQDGGTWRIVRNMKGTYAWDDGSPCTTVIVNTNWEQSVTVTCP
jgi:hypothetical protein